MNEYQRRGEAVRLGALAAVEAIDRACAGREMTPQERRARIAAVAAAEFMARTAHETEPPAYLREP